MKPLAISLCEPAQRAVDLYRDSPSPRPAARVTEALDALESLQRALLLVGTDEMRARFRALVREFSVIYEADQAGRAGVGLLRVAASTAVRESQAVEGNL